MLTGESSGDRRANSPEGLAPQGGTVRVVEREGGVERRVAVNPRGPRVMNGGASASRSVGRGRRGCRVLDDLTLMPALTRGPAVLPRVLRWTVGCALGSCLALLLANWTGAGLVGARRRESPAGGGARNGFLGRGTLGW